MHIVKVAQFWKVNNRAEEALPLHLSVLYSPFWNGRREKNWISI